MMSASAPSPPHARLGFRRTLLVLFAGLVISSFNARAGVQRPIKKLSVDPSAEKIGLFEGMKNGSLEVKLIQKNSLKGNMLVTNKTKKPLTVELPEAFVGVQVLKQGGFFGNNQQQGQQNGIGNGSGGGAQSTGGGSQQSNNQSGNNFFSVPSKKTVLVPYTSVCLEHGKPEPRVRMNYRPIPVEQFSDDAVLHSLLKLVARGRIDPKTAQAAAWHLSDKMSWKKLVTKQIKHLGGKPPTRYFTSRQIQKAKQLVDKATIVAAKKNKAKKANPVVKAKRDDSIARVSRNN